MSTALSRTTSFVRKFAFFGIIAVIVIWVLQATTHFLDPIVQITPSVRPTGSGTSYGSCPTPTRTFGKIPSLKLSSYALATGTKAKFSTDKTKFPTMPTTLTVYKLNKFYAKIDDVDRVKLTASAMGFNPDNYASEDNYIRWQNADETKFFSFDKSTHIWDLTTDLNNTSLSTLTKAASDYVKVGDNIIKAVKVSNSNYLGYETEYLYVLRKFDRSFESTTQISKANIVKFTYYKTIEAITCKGVDNKPLVTRGRIIAPDYKDQSFTAQATGTGASLTTDLLSVNLREFDISSTTGIYPAITFEEAYTLLQENKGTLYWIIQEGNNYFTAYKELKVKEFQIVVDSTSIVYLEPQKYIDNDETTNYIQPYYKFIGKATLDNNAKADFVFLVPALKTEEYK